MNGKRKENMEAGGWLRTAAFSSISGCLVNTYLQPSFKLVKEMTMKVSLYNLFRRI